VLNPVVALWRLNVVRQFANDKHQAAAKVHNEDQAKEDDKKLNKVGVLELVQLLHQLAKAKKAGHLKKAQHLQVDLHPHDQEHELKGKGGRKVNHEPAPEIV
jgi:hypothetical protein